MRVVQKTLAVIIISSFIHIGLNAAEPIAEKVTTAEIAAAAFLKGMATGKFEEVKSYLTDYFFEMNLEEAKAGSGAVRGAMEVEALWKKAEPLDEFSSMTIGEKSSAPLDDWEGVGETGRKFEEQKKQILADGYVKGTDTLVKLQITQVGISEESIARVTDSYFVVVRHVSDGLKVIALLVPVEGAASDIRKRDAAPKPDK